MLEPHLGIIPDGGHIEAFEVFADVVDEVDFVMLLQGSFNSGDDMLLVVGACDFPRCGEAEGVVGELGDGFDHDGNGFHLQRVLATGKCKGSWGVAARHRGLGV